MAQPIIYNINAFDANKSANIAFSYTGEQVFGSEMVVINNETGAEVLTIKAEKSMAQYCTIAPWTAAERQLLRLPCACV